MSEPVKKYWGYHLALDCAGCSVSKIQDSENIIAFFNELLEVTNMQKWGEPLLQNLQEGPEHIRGYTAVQLISTSSVTCHFCDYTGEAYIDFFSCKSFRLEDVVVCVQKYFEPKHVKQQYLVRNAHKI